MNICNKDKTIHFKINELVNFVVLCAVYNTIILKNIFIIRHKLDNADIYPKKNT